MDIDVILESPLWDDLALEALCSAVGRAVGEHLALTGSFCVMACDDARIAALNTEFRAKPTPTNVLSWPSEERAAAQAGGAPLAPSDPDWGDIAIAYETCAREAADQGKPISAHVTHLILHGVLHLLGYDHETDADAARMEGLEVEILGKMGLANPYEPE